MDQGKLSQSDDQESQNVSQKDRAAGIEDGESRSAISDDEDASQTPDDDFSKKFGVGYEEKASKVQEDLTKKNEFDAVNRMFKPTYVENDDARTLGDVFKINEESLSDRGSMENFTENRKDSKKPKSPFNKDGNILTDDDDVNDGSIGASKESGGILRGNLGDIRKEREPNNLSADYEGSSGGLGSQKLYTPPPVARNPFTWITGSVYDGTWDLLGMSGRGSYTMPHGVVYEGALKDGKFHGKGTLNYPSGCCINGVWDNGVLQSTSFHFSDGLSFKNVESWKYCKMPDRRFYKEHILGLRPAGLSHLTQETPTRPIPEGCYDVGDGFYDPRTKCVTDPEDGRITRVPTAAEEDWILANCRKAWDQPQGYRPDLCENWWSEQGCKAGDQEEEEDLQ